MPKVGDNIGPEMFSLTPTAAQSDSPWPVAEFPISLGDTVTDRGMQLETSNSEVQAQSRSRSLSPVPPDYRVSEGPLKKRFSPLIATARPSASLQEGFLSPKVASTDELY